MKQVREVKEDDKACRICNKFKCVNSCWKSIEDFGEKCKEFKRNPETKTVVDFIN